ncbi:MAG: hypothetical protein OT477_24225, partial [Chloroflexi bacterium]|nr:hypothetical protein [Chloroflexota bacterium]
NPVGLAFNPVGLAFNPVGLAFNPVGLAFNPVGFDSHSSFGWHVIDSFFLTQGRKGAEGAQRFFACALLAFALHSPSVAIIRTTPL